MTALQWEIIEQSLRIPKDFKTTTEIWSSEKEVTISTVIERLFVKLYNLAQFINKETNSLTGRQFAKELVKTLRNDFQSAVQV